MSLKIITYPNPVLDKPSQNVTVPLTSQTQTLIKEMFKIVKGKGVGLAAPQVGVDQNLCIIHLSEDKDLAKKFKTPDFVMINPSILFESQTQVSMIEGCLSFPDQYYEITRAANIKVEYLTIKNLNPFIYKNAKPILKKEVLQTKDWLARVILHEVDHLRGNLFINLGGKKIVAQDLKDKIVVD